MSRKQEVQRVTELLEAHDDEGIVDLILTSDPWLFNGTVHDFGSWRDELARGKSIVATDIFVVGSASVGFSLAPEKAGRPFRELRGGSTPSDIDVAVIDADLFIQSWEQLVEAERRLALHVRYEQRPRMRTGIYWGHLFDSYVPINTRPSRTLRSVASAVSRSAASRGYPSSIRLYRRLEDLRQYQLRNIKNLRRQLGGG